MKNIKVNTEAIITIILSSIIINDLIKKVGDKVVKQEYVWEWYHSLMVLFFLSFIFYLGKKSKFN
jgi:hypothetical protein